MNYDQQCNQYKKKPKKNPEQLALTSNQRNTKKKTTTVWRWRSTSLLSTNFFFGEAVILPINLIQTLICIVGTPTTVHCYVSWSFFVFSEWRWEVIIRFVDIGGIDDCRCLNFVFII